jgi:preprotein translocase subunit YajC
MQKIVKGCKVMTYKGIEYKVLNVQSDVLTVVRTAEGYTDNKKININAVFEVY